MSAHITDEIKRRLEQRLAQLNLGVELFEEIIGQTMVVGYPAGSPIFYQGSSAELLLWLVKGVVKVYCPFEVEGARVLTRLAGPGDLLGQVNYLNCSGHRQLLEAHAATKCEIAVVGRECAMRVFERLEKSDLIRLVSHLNLMWSESLFWYVSLIGLGFKHRLEVVLADLCARFGVREKRGILIIPELSQLDLAEMIGSSRPMITRLLKEMTEGRELIRHGKQVIVSPDVQWLSRRPLLPVTERKKATIIDQSYQTAISNRAA